MPGFEAEAIEAQSGEQGRWPCGTNKRGSNAPEVVPNWLEVDSDWLEEESGWPREDAGWLGEGG